MYRVIGKLIASIYSPSYGLKVSRLSEISIMTDVMVRNVDEISAKIRVTYDTGSLGYIWIIFHGELPLRRIIFVRINSHGKI